MSVVHAWAGAAGPSGFTVAAKVTGTSTRLAVSDQITVDNDTIVLQDPTFFGPETPDLNGYVKLAASGLDADSEWWWQLEDDAVLDTDATGKVRTHPPVGEPASFTFAASACAGNGTETWIVDDVSNSPIFETLEGRADEWLFFHHMGDLHYRDIGTDDVGLFRSAYEDVLTFNGTEGVEARQARFYRQLAISYQWDDHDYGPNNSDRTSAAREAAQQAYREVVPHHPLPDGEGIQQAWQVGRVLFVADDHRSFRDPNTDPDGPSKTMLGQAQKAWLDELLATTDAQVLVWFTDHFASTPDTWALYGTEADEVRQIITDRGFADRTVVIAGDIHQLGIDTGAGEHNLWGMPTFQFASLDSDSGTVHDQFDLGSSDGRDRYGTVDVADDGSTITLTGTGWIGHTLWQAHTVEFDLTGDGDGDGGPAPDPGPVQSIASIRQSIAWVACDTVSGKIIQQLPAPTGGPISRVIGHPTSTGLSFPTAALPTARWDRVTEPLRTMIVAIIHDVPAWGGIVLNPVDGSGQPEQLAVASPEVYLDHRFVGDHRFDQIDLVTIAAQLVAEDAQPEGIGFVIATELSGELADRTYADDEDAAVLDRLQELMDVTGGPEFTVDLEWDNPDHTVVSKVLRIAPRVGRDTDVIFESLADTDATAKRSRDWADGRGANHVVATSSGEGEDRPASSPARDEASIVSRGRWEHRFTPSSSIKRKATLDRHAQAELARRRHGSTTWDLSADWNAYPRYGVDWRLGDGVSWVIHNDRHPNGIAGRGRIIGWSLDLASMRVTPQFAEEQ